jgi:Tol biopolymer transport system component
MAVHRATAPGREVSTMRRPGRWISIAMVSALAVLVAPLVPAGATFAGANGRIAFGEVGVRHPRIGTVNPDGSGLAWVTSRRFSADHPSWSADGTTIAYQRYGQGNWQIWTMRADGTDQRRVIGGGATTPSFGPDGRVAFARGGDIWTVKPDGTAAVNLTPSTTYTDSSPSWSPNGTWIVFQRCCYAGFGGQATQIIRMAPDGTAKRNLSGNGGATADFHPDFNGSSTEIVFSRYDGTSYDRFWAMAADGSNQHKVDPQQNGSSCVWSPDGMRIAYYGTPGHPPYGVYTMAATGGDVRFVIEGANPAWQPIPG